uniref:CCHC-type domain-containing protein n=1 Tax=Oryzias latipes TaxID=8090 RepID=A0A3P9I1Z9_ORYLA
MEVVAAENVKVPNSLLVSGLTGAVTDNEVIEFLQMYGPISRVVKLSSSDPDFKNTAIVEFQSGHAVEALQERLPCQRPTSDPDVSHGIQLLSTLYSTKLTSDLTLSYLADLKGVAKTSGTEYERILLEELAKIQKSANGKSLGSLVQPTESQTLSPDSGNDVAIVDSNLAQTSQTADPIGANLRNVQSVIADLDFKASSSTEKPTYALTSEQISPPEVQRLVVEHVVKGSEIPQSPHGSSKLRPFSGRVPCPNLEVDYDTWRGHVEFYLADPTISEKQLVRKIIESLLPPAGGIVKQLGPLSRPQDFLSLLDSAYGTVDDVDELFAKFLNTNQDAGEKPSIYLHRLQATLSKIVKGGGISSSDSDRQLLKQFCRGCWDNGLITSLQLEQKKLNPPQFSELLLLLRTEEDKQSAKSSRMKQHLGLSKLKVQSHPQNVYSGTGATASSSSDDPTPAVTKKLQKQIAELQAQLSSLKASMNEPLNKKQHTKAVTAKKSVMKESADNLPQFSTNFGNSSKKPRAGYCFRCGEDGHIAPSCSNDPNPQVVDAKRKQLKEKQKLWDEQNKFDLN